MARRVCGLSRYLLTVCVGLFMYNVCVDRALAEETTPVVHDPRLELALIAQDPELVTPIGLAIDGRDRLFVLESHTHERPANYHGPRYDQVKMFGDADGDGVFEDVSIFADRITTGLNLAFSPDGVLYVVCAREVLALPDADDDGRCDGSRNVLTMRTHEGYSHNCLLSITFDGEGWMYLGRGNTGGRAYEFVGSDGSQVSGYGDGGSILRCRPDGSRISEFATGFWNPFSIKFDHAGRLLCVDNDPDARGPNRLVHVVEGGDYGYKSLYGGGGNHPFQGWDGSLPGTLPYISGTGEVPCDLIDCRRSSLPEDFADSILVTVWNENTIERHATRPRGVSLTAESSVLVSGGDLFRPVAIEADSRGNLYFTDWVLVAYPNHGRGRLWRLTAKPGNAALPPREYFDPPRVEVNMQVPRLDSRDAFEQHAAVMDLASSASEQQLIQLANEQDEELRLGSLLAAARSTLDEAALQRLARRFLGDPHERVRQAALVWVGTGLMTTLRADIERAIEADDVSAVLFETYLAAVQNLDPEFAAAVRGRTKAKSKEIKPRLDEGFLLNIAADGNRRSTLRRLALQRLDVTPRSRGLLMDVAGSAETALQLAAIQRLSGDASDDVLQLLRRLAADVGQVEAVRCEAILALSRDSQLDPRLLLPFIDDASVAVAVEAARALQPFREQQTVITAIDSKLRALPNQADVVPLAEQLSYALGEQSNQRPAALDEQQLLVAWQQTLETGGDAAAGRRVFYSPRASCANCHSTDGIGGTLGPDLSHIAQSVDRRQIIRSILRPSDQFPPQYQAWVVLTSDGQTHTGLQLDHKAGGAIELFTTQGTTQHFAAADIEQYRASSQSIMPAGLESNLSVGELRDLVAYLESLR